MTTYPLPSPEEIRALLPLSQEGEDFVHGARQTAKDILSGKDSRLALIVGPCSIHEHTSALEYAQRLKGIAERVEQSCFLIMRVYVEKPRTLSGWKGLLYDPYLDGSNDIETGLMWTRELLLTLARMQMPCATEFVDPLAALYFEDLITWGFIGARTSASQPHRQFASLLSMPIGFKNSTDGNLDHAIHGVLCAREPHALIHSDAKGKLCTRRTLGNPSTHIVLRGAYESSNYDAFSVLMAAEKLREVDLPQRLLIDCSHGNSQKKFDNQRKVFSSVLEQIERGSDKIMGLMLESHLESGNQPLTEDPSLLRYAVSITDPCLDWEATEELVYSADLALSKVCTS